MNFSQAQLRNLARRVARCPSAAIPFYPGGSAGILKQQLGAARSFKSCSVFSSPAPQLSPGLLAHKARVFQSLTPSQKISALNQAAARVPALQRSGREFSTLVRRIQEVGGKAPVVAYQPSRGFFQVSQPRRGGLSFGYGEDGAGSAPSWLPSISNIVISLFLLLTCAFTFTDFIIMTLYIMFNQTYRSPESNYDDNEDLEAEEQLKNLIAPERTHTTEYAVVVAPDNRLGCDMVRKVVSDLDMDDTCIFINVFPDGVLGGILTSLKFGGMRPHIALGEYTMSLFLNKLIKMYRILTFLYDLDVVPTLVVDLRSLEEPQQAIVAANVLEGMSVGRGLCRGIVIIPPEAAIAYSPRDDMNLLEIQRHNEHTVVMKGANVDFEPTNSF